MGDLAPDHRDQRVKIAVQQRKVRDHALLDPPPLALANGGAGVFREEVTAPFGIAHPVLAWGLGASRLAMLRLGLKDLRQLYRSDIDWCRETYVYSGRGGR